jgi:anti-sigma B factor antagonist
MRLEEIARADGIVQVALHGSLDAHGLHAVDVSFHGCTAARRRPAIVDLTGVEFVNSLGVGMLITVAMSLRRHGAGMAIVCPPGRVAEVLERAGLDKVVPVVATVADAEALLGGAAAARDARDVVRP